jgi:peptidoglycan-associated lipoprotein
MLRAPLLLVALTAAATLSLGCEIVTAPATPPTPSAEAPPAPTNQVSKVGHVRVTEDHLVIDQKILFAHDSDVIQRDSNGLLDEIATVVNDTADIESLKIVGHTDVTGDDAHNKDLSQRRAGSVAKALRDRGVSKTIDAYGAGEEELACSELTDVCHEQNRRVEFRIAKGNRLTR